MGNVHHIQQINFEDMQTVIEKNNIYMIISTLSSYEQNCLIKNTIDIEQEERTINKYIKADLNIHIIIYGKHCNDPSIQIKYQQLTSLGFRNIFIYQGGLFEWLLLQDVYGTDLFQTTKKENDILKYKSPPILNIPLIKYGDID